MNSYMKYVILAPANIQSGGPELAHQLCYKLNAIGRTATMYYCSSDGSHPVDIDAMPKYQKYNTKHEINYEEVDFMKIL
ncbi:MAG: hypothetical protein MJZ11_07545 [Lachnospiraceae bacterium]|nr:hypothetical protein [Lachnospiraceae bacterium]